MCILQHRLGLSNQISILQAREQSHRYVSPRFEGVKYKQNKYNRKMNDQWFSKSNFERFDWEKLFEDINNVYLKGVNIV